MDIWSIFRPFDIFYGHLVCFVFIWYILCSFGIFYVHLVYFVFIWYVFTRVGILYQENLATLTAKPFLPVCRASVAKCDLNFQVHRRDLQAGLTLATANN
jgi:hypothetical protein